MSEEALKIVLGLLSAIIATLVGAFSATFIPLLQRARRAQQEVELGLKEVERIDKVLNVAARLKADYGVQTDMSEVGTRLRLIVANMASDEEKSATAIREYIAATPTFWSGIQTDLPRIRAPRELSLTIRSLRIMPFVGILSIIGIFIIIPILDKDTSSAELIDLLKKTLANEYFPLVIVGAALYYLIIKFNNRAYGRWIIRQYQRRHPEFISSNTQVSVEQLR